MALKNCNFIINNLNPLCRIISRSRNALQRVYFSTDLETIWHPEEKADAEIADETKMFLKDRGYNLPHDFRFKYVEFFPLPNAEWRNELRERLERLDMLARRKMVDIPEFYVGSVLAVTTTDRHCPGKKNRFVGICIQRTYAGLKATFLLRNVIDNQGVEINYELYSPLILRIEVLKLEKRLDEELIYLRDAPPEYSTFPFDMEPQIQARGSPVLLNEIKVPLNPLPWYQRYHIKNLKGIILPELDQKTFSRIAINAKPWEKYDIMDQYRATIPVNEQELIFKDIEKELQKLEKPQSIEVKKKSLKGMEPGQLF